MKGLLEIVKTNKKNDRRSFIKEAGGVAAGFALTSSLLASENTPQSSIKNMSFFDVIKKRQSIRKFKSTAIPDEHIDMILNAARMAPTAGNQQPWKFLVVRDRKLINKTKQVCYELGLKETYSDEDPPAEGKESLKQYYDDYFSAPLYLLVFTDSNSKYPSYNDKDGPLAAGYAVLAATALGYGTVFCTDSIYEEATKKVFKYPDNLTRVCAIPIGVPAETPEQPEKKNIGEFVVYDKF